MDEVVEPVVIVVVDELVELVVVVRVEINVIDRPIKISEKTGMKWKTNLSSISFSSRHS